MRERSYGQRGRRLQVENGIPKGQVARRQAIRSCLRNQWISTQEELREWLAKEGFDVNQATLSRDLAHLGARRLSVPGKGTAYELADTPRQSIQDETRLSALGVLVSSVAENGTLVVVHTQTGAASAVAVALDAAQWPEVMGTLAGDDTVFIAPKRGRSAAKLAKKLDEVFRQSGLSA